MKSIKRLKSKICGNAGLKEATLLAIVSLASTQANAQVSGGNWGSTIKNVLDTAGTQLKLIGGGIALICLFWSAYQIIWGGKRLQDMTPWFLGAFLFFIAPQLVSLFFG